MFTAKWVQKDIELVNSVALICSDICQRCSVLLIGSTEILNAQSQTEVTNLTNQWTSVKLLELIY